MESAALRQADQITYQSAPVLDQLNRTFFDVSSKATLVMNGFDEKMLQRSPAPRAPVDDILIGYFGAINDRADSYRNPTTFLEAAWRSGLPLRVVFYGDVALDPAWHKRLGARLEVHGNIPHDEAIRKMREMDLLMLLHSQQENSEEVIPGKLFEYMLAGRPILVIGPRLMEAKRIVQTERIGYTAEAADPADIRETLAAVCSDWRLDNLPDVDPSRLSSYSRQSQNAKILELLR
jgi:glycosyltransferase involved in cell wall biosynthesis